MAEVKEYTRYEVARILGARALQIAMDAPLLMKNISHEKKQEQAKNSRNNRCNHPSAGNSPQCTPADTPAALKQTDTDHGSHDGLGTGNRNQGDCRQSMTG